MLTLVAADPGETTEMTSYRAWVIARTLAADPYKRGDLAAVANNSKAVVWSKFKGCQYSRAVMGEVEHALRTADVESRATR